MRRTLNGRRVLITGASSGIGKALCLKLAALGTQLVLVARRDNLLDEVARQVLAAGSEAVAVRADLAIPEDRQRVVEQTQARFGGLDILVNNAGVGANGRFEIASSERLRAVMEVNFFATAELTRLAIPMLKRGTTPLIVNVGSILGRRGIPHYSEYCASKFALQGWSEALRAELAPAGIDLVMVNPGTTETEFKQKLLESRGEDPWPPQPRVTPETVAQAMLRAMQRGTHEIVPNRRGRWMLRLNRFCPSFLDSYLTRYG